MLKKWNKKGIVLLIAVGLILSAAVGTTLAYLLDKTEPVTDTFSPANVKCEVSQNGSMYQVTNRSNIAVYIRVAVTVNAIDGGGNLIWNAALSSTVDAKDWTSFGGYYYYKGAVAADATVSFETVAVSGVADYEVQVFAEAIQSTPLDAVEGAWGMTYSDANGWTAKR